MVYLGSKRRMAQYIKPFIDKALSVTGFTCYVEPFCGGANMVDKVAAPMRIGTDSNKYLIALLQRLQGGTWNI